MDALAKAFGPAFAAAFALQQFVELVQPSLKRLGDKRVLAIRLLSLAVGITLSFVAGLRVLSGLGYAGPWAWDALITGLIISGGTEGFNSVLKYLGYAKDLKKELPGKPATASHE